MKLSTITDEMRRKIVEHASKRMKIDLTEEPLTIVKGDREPVWDNEFCTIIVGKDWKPFSEEK